MIDLGVATSVARENQYSWQDTVDFANNYELNSIQFYYTQNKISPQVTGISNFKNTYLHLPNNYDSVFNELISFVFDFRKKYNSNKLIIHQKEELSIKKTKKIVAEFNQAGFLVGIENEGSKDLNSFYKLAETFEKSRLEYFIIVDVHRFFCNYSDRYSQEEIFNFILKILIVCNNSNIAVVLHVIDSNSFKSQRSEWTALFEGIVPYRDLLKFTQKNQIKIESLIFEYENYEQVKKSLENLKKFGYNTGK